MDKKTGNLWMFFLIVSMFPVINCHNKHIDFSIQNLQQQEIKQAEIGIPFILQLTVENVEGIVEPQGLENSANCVIQFYGTTQSMSMINGARNHKVIFTYVVTAHTKGSLALGPITLTDTNDDILTLDKIHILVGDIAEPEYKNKEPYVLAVNTEKSTVYVGQKTTISLRFCYTDSFDNLVIDNVPVVNAHCGYQEQNWQQDTVKLGDNEYSCKKAYFELYPITPGTLVIPQFKATFVPAQKYQQQLFGSGLFNVLGLSNTRVVQSHPKGIEVIALPESSEFSGVTAVGKFHTMSVSTTQKKWKVGEGIVLKMVVEGDGNLEIVKAPELQLPVELQCYEGNNSLNRVNDKHSIKTFDWILQADQSGTFKIPQQVFAYFDPEQKVYKALKSSSITIEVDGGTQPVPVAEEPFVDVVSDKNEEKEAEFVIPLDIPDSENNKFARMSSVMLNWLIMIILMIIMVIFGGYIIYPYLKKSFFMQALHHRFVFWKVCRGNNVQELYIFFDGLAGQYHFGLQDQQLQKMFHDLNLSDEVFQNWQNFIAMLLESNFAKYRSEEDKQLAFQLAKQWFPIILSCCKLMYKKSRILSEN